MNNLLMRESEITCWWPVRRALWFLFKAGSQRNIVKSSEPETNLSGALPLILLYLASAAWERDK